MLTFGLLIITVIIDEIGTVLFPSNNVNKLATVAVVLMTATLLFFLFKKMNQTARELHTLEQKVKNIFDTLDIAIWSHDLKTNKLLITPGIEKLYGYTSEAFYRDFSLWKKVIHPEDLGVLTEREQKLSVGVPDTSEYRIIRPDGKVRWIQDSGFPTINEFGDFIDFNSVLFDITDRKESEDRYRSLVELSPDFVAVINQGKITYINETGSYLLGASGPCDIIGLSAEQFAPADIIAEMRKSEKFMTGDKSKVIRYEFKLKRIDGLLIDAEMSAMPILLGGRMVTQVVGRDITDRKKTEKTIQYMAFYDTLTGLPNRNMFKKYLNEVLDQRKDQMAAILFLDLDRFKVINDTRGHSTGDIVLQRVAKRLQSTMQNKGMVSRQGGDEFIILAEDTDKEGAAIIAQRILDEFSKPVEINDQEFFITPSIGITIYPAHGNDEETLIKNADTAMFAAKRYGKNKFQFYASSLNGNSIQMMELENGLRKAIEKDQLILHYQPQIELTTGNIVGIEALLRWQHPNLGLIPPLEFISLAEETGLIVPIGKWVLQTACMQNKAWHEAGLQKVPIAVNISARQLQEDHFVDYIIEVLDHSGLNPKYLDLEITESIMQNIEESTAILNRLKEQGIHLSIDDFGTGYSSLSYLRYLPIDKIKIDKSFVDDILFSPTQGVMAKTIIDMGNHLQFSVIAEGIEHVEQVDFLKQNECNIGQGYFFSRPLTVDKMEEYLENMSKVEVV